jgi:polyhydroxyalkanoate synthase subunit PhaC
MATAQANADNAAAPLDQLLLAACSGGIITSMLLGHPAACGGQDRIAGLGLLVTVLDQAKGGLPAALASKAMLDRAAASWARKGYLDGATLAELFAWLRPVDLIWNYWVNNYLLPMRSGAACRASRIGAR